MSGGHAHPLHLHGHSRVHRLPSETKVVAMLVFVAVVVLTPREAFWAFAVYGWLVVTVLGTAGIPFGFFLRRVAVEAPFLLFALLLPFVGAGERVEVGGVSLSVEGLWGAWNIFAKATLGLSASVILAATTEIPDILAGLDRLRAPRIFTAIAGFMVRYLDLIIDEARRMRVAMLSRGYDPRWLWQAKAYATSAGSLFIRSYERGERVYRAMVARGFSGTMPMLGSAQATAADWRVALTLPGLAAAVAVVAMVVTR